MHENKSTVQLCPNVSTGKQKGLVSIMTCHNAHARDKCQVYFVHAILAGSGQRTCAQSKLEAAVISVKIMQLRA